MPVPLKRRASLVTACPEAGELPLITLDVVDSGGGRLTTDELPARPMPNAGFALAQSGDVLYGKLRPYLAKSMLVTFPAYVSTELLALRPTQQLDPRFLSYVVRARPFIEWTVATSEGTKMPRTSWEKAGSFAVEDLTLQQQRAIADFLDTETARIDALITRKCRLIEVLARRTEALVARHLDPLIAQHGETPAGAVAELRVSNVDKKTHEGQAEVRLCNYTDVYYNRSITAAIDFMTASADPIQTRRFQLQPGDVLVTKDSESADDIGVPALVTEPLPGVVLGYHLALYRPRRVEASFLYWTLRSRRCADAFALAASGVTRFGLRHDAMRRIPVAAAPADDQRAAAAAIEHQVGVSESICARLQHQLTLIREHR